MILTLEMIYVVESSHSEASKKIKDEFFALFLVTQQREKIKILQKAQEPFEISTLIITFHGRKWQNHPSLLSK